jgi:hypothetical protein
MHDAASVAIAAVFGAATRVEYVRFVLFGKEAHAVFLAQWERFASRRAKVLHPNT